MFLTEALHSATFYSWFVIFALRAAKIEKDYVKVNFRRLVTTIKNQTTLFMFLNTPLAWLKRGDCIKIIAPAGLVEKSYIDHACSFLRKEGLEVKLGVHLFNSYFQFAGTDTERLADLQHALDDTSIKAIWCARGGYGAIRLLELLHWDEFKKNPKWLMGFSDITLLHACINQLGYPSMHCAMPINFNNIDLPVPDWASQTIRYLMGGELAHSFPKNDFNRGDEISGIITGGNLSMLCAISGTPYDIDYRGKILFIEEVSEHKYKIDRMMQSLRLSGKLSQIKGLLVGGFTDVMDNKRPFGKDVEEIILDAVKGFDYPVIFNVPAGHLEANYPIPFGVNITVDDAGNGMKLRAEWHKSIS